MNEQLEKLLEKQSVLEKKLEDVAGRFEETESTMDDLTATKVDLENDLDELRDSIEGLDTDDIYDELKHNKDEIESLEEAMENLKEEIAEALKESLETQLANYFYDTKTLFSEERRRQKRRNTNF